MVVVMVLNMRRHLRALQILVVVEEVLAEVLGMALLVVQVLLLFGLIFHNLNIKINCIKTPLIFKGVFS